MNELWWAAFVGGFLWGAIVSGVCILLVLAVAKAVKRGE
jgi:hypothetical protein